MLSQFLKYFIFFAFFGMLSGCSTMPLELSTNNPQVITNYQNWVPETQVGSEVRLGGVIADVKNQQSKTRIEIVNLPLSSSGKPDINRDPKGRYIAYLHGFVDPVTLAKGRLISVIGKSKVPEMTMVGEYQGQFPAMDVVGYHLWRVEEQVINRHIGSYLHPCHSVFCHDDDFNQEQIIQVVK